MSPIKTLFLILIFPCLSFGQADSMALNSDTAQKSVTKTDFEKAPNAKFKLDYYHTEGYSTREQYWYEIIIIDSLVVLNFQSPKNEGWDFVYYQKQKILEDTLLSEIKNVITASNVQQKTKEFPPPPSTRYVADRLYIVNMDHYA